MNENKRVIGSLYEKQAAAYLKKQGLRIVESNYRFRGGEIDLIARDGAYIVFVEVKYRSTGCSGDALCAVDKAKQRMISKTAKFYLTVRRRNVDLPCRFDVVGIDGNEIHWIKNAFDYCE